MNTLPLLFNKNNDAECSDKCTGGRLDNEKEGVEMEININEARKHFGEVTVLRSGGLTSSLPDTCNYSFHHKDFKGIGSDGDGTIQLAKST